MNGDNVRAISILRSIRNIALDVGSSIGASKESVIEAMGMAIGSLDRPSTAPGALPEFPEPFGFAAVKEVITTPSADSCVTVQTPTFTASQMHAYARAYAEQCRAGGWLPIESAPNKQVLLFYPPLRNSYGKQTHDTYFRIGYPGETPRNPTHWMPLPAPPALQSALADDEGVKHER